MQDEELVDYNPNTELFPCGGTCPLTSWVETMEWNCIDYCMEWNTGLRVGVVVLSLHLMVSTIVDKVSHNKPISIMRGFYNTSTT